MQHLDTFDTLTKVNIFKNKSTFLMCWLISLTKKTFFFCYVLLTFFNKILNIFVPFYTFLKAYSNSHIIFFHSALLHATLFQVATQIKSNIPPFYDKSSNER